MNIITELNDCGHSILGALYLSSFVTIGAFVLANLMVAVVVTNLVSDIYTAVVASSKRVCGKTLNVHSYI